MYYYIAYTSLILLLTALETNSISFHSGQTERCFSKELYVEDELHLSFSISGQNQDSIWVSLQDPSKRDLRSWEGDQDGKFNTTLKETGQYTVCFKPKSTIQSQISFDFYGKLDSGHIIHVAKGETLSDMQRDILSLQTMLEEMEINTKYIIERQQSHSDSKNI